MTTTAYQRFRRDVGLDEDDTASLSDPAIDNLIEEAGELYSGAAANSYGRVLYLRGRLASASTEVSYRQNESQESASDRFDHWRALLEYWEARTDQAAAGAGIGAAAVFDLAHGWRGR